MPGYGVSGPEHGTGLWHWSWAAERLTAARELLGGQRLAGRPSAHHARLGHVG